MCKLLCRTYDETNKKNTHTQQNNRTPEKRVLLSLILFVCLFVCHKTVLCMCLKAMLDMAKEIMYHGLELDQDVAFCKMHVWK